MKFPIITRQRVLILFLGSTLILWVSIVIMAPTKTSTDTTIRSDNDDSVIQSLNTRIETLKNSEANWHKAYLWLILGTGLFGLLVYLAQYKESRKASERADAQQQLIKLKDVKSQHELEAMRAATAAADERAGKANERAAALEAETAQSRILIANAQADAAKATERAALAESHLAESKAQAKLAEQHAKEADAKAEGFRLDIAKANESARQAEARAAEANLEVAKLKSARTLDTGELDRLTSALGSFGGTKFVLSVNPTAESINLASLIASSLVSAKWIPIEPRRPNEGPPATVSVGPVHAALWYRSGIAVGFRPEDRASLSAAADALATALENRFPVETSLFGPEVAYGEQVVQIVVGSKP